jgi:hypothetical protein
MNANELMSLENPFGLAPIKGEGMLVDPDTVTFKCKCKKCQEGYRKWKADYLKEQKEASQK